jgi:hypothetical protein
LRDQARSGARATSPAGIRRRVAAAPLTGGANAINSSTIHEGEEAACVGRREKSAMRVSRAPNIAVDCLIFQFGMRFLPQAQFFTGVDSPLFAHIQSPAFVHMQLPAA